MFINVESGYNCVRWVGKRPRLLSKRFVHEAIFLYSIGWNRATKHISDWWNFRGNRKTLRAIVLCLTRGGCWFFVAVLPVRRELPFRLMYLLEIYRHPQYICLVRLVEIYRHPQYICLMHLVEIYRHPQYICLVHLVESIGIHRI